MIHSLTNPFKFGSRSWLLYWLSPKTYWHPVRDFWQRGKRGYADTDVWNLCDYIVEWLPDAMRLLREKGHAWPGEWCTGAATQEEWRERLKEIEDGFRAARLLMSDDIPTEYFTGTDCVPVEINVPDLELDRSVQRMCRNPEKYREELKAKFEKGMEVFYTYYFHLWD